MKAITICLAALGMIAGVIGEADAASHHKKKRHYATHYGKHHYRVYGYRDNDDSLAGYYEHRLDAVRFGSQRWWKIYDEQHGRPGR